MIKKYNIVVNGNSYEVQVEELGTESSSVQTPQKQTQVAKPSPMYLPSAWHEGGSLELPFCSVPAGGQGGQTAIPSTLSSEPQLSFRIILDTGPEMAGTNQVELA